MKKTTKLLLGFVLIFMMSKAVWASNQNWAGKNKTIAPGGKVLIGMLPNDTFSYHSSHLVNQKNCNYQSNQFGCIACVVTGYPNNSYKVDSFKWTPNINLSYIEKHFMPHALASPTVTTTYHVTVYLQGGTIQHDSVTVTVNASASNPVFTIPNNYIVQCPFDTSSGKTNFKHDFAYSITGGVGNPKNYQFKLFDVYIDSSFLFNNTNSNSSPNNYYSNHLQLIPNNDSIHVGFNRDTTNIAYDYGDDYYAVIEATDSAGITNSGTIAIHFQPMVGCDFVPTEQHYYTPKNTPFNPQPQPQFLPNPGAHNGGLGSVNTDWMHHDNMINLFNPKSKGVLFPYYYEECWYFGYNYMPKYNTNYIDTILFPVYPNYHPFNLNGFYYQNLGYYCGADVFSNQYIISFCQNDFGIFNMKFSKLIFHVSDTIQGILKDTTICAGDSFNIKPIINKILLNNYYGVTYMTSPPFTHSIPLEVKMNNHTFFLQTTNDTMSNIPVYVPITKSDKLVFIYSQSAIYPVQSYYSTTGCRVNGGIPMPSYFNSTYSDTINITATHCVWPGDADDNGVANLQDLFPIGLGNGISGLARNNASITWQAQDVNNWSGASFGTPNWKYADCDGNGTINGNDTIAIVQNFSLTHPKPLNENHKSGLPPLAIKIQPSIYNASTQQLQATISLGNTALPLDSVYGITFGFNFDANYIDTSKITYSVLNSWLFANATDHFWLNHHQLQNGVMNFALVRNNQIGKAGFGDIMQINLPLSSNLTTQPDLSQFITSLSNVKVINQIGTEIAVSVVTDSSLYSVLLSANEILNKTNELTIYPNPVGDKLLVISNKFLVNTIEVTDMLGKVCTIPPFQRGQGGLELNTENLLSGTYFIKATDTKGNVWNGKFVKE